MNDFRSYEKLVPAASASACSSSRRTTTTRVGIVAVVSSTIITGALISLAVGSINLEDMTSSSDVIRTACNKTQYIDLCISSLSSYPGAVYANLSDLSRIAVAVSLDGAQRVSQYIADLTPNVTDKSEIGALEDCIQLFQDTVDRLNDSVSALTSKQRTGDVQTWLSAALTNPSTCVEGLEDVDATVISLVRPKSENVRELISNALAIFVNVLFTAEDMAHREGIVTFGNRRLFSVTI